MAKLNVNAFSENFREYAQMECALYLYECLNEDEKIQIKKSWEKAGGVNTMPWFKWCMKHIDVKYNGNGDVL